LYSSEYSPFYWKNKDLPLNFSKNTSELDMV